jgi:hypothetical protein
MDYPIYYKVQLSYDRFIVCTLQEFDEYAYDKSDWATDEEFPEEEKAISFCDRLNWALYDKNLYHMIGKVSTKSLVVRLIGEA